jgi:hypothetical protein
MTGAGYVTQTFFQKNQNQQEIILISANYTPNVATRQGHSIRVLFNLDW